MTQEWLIGKEWASTAVPWRRSARCRAGWALVSTARVFGGYLGEPASAYWMSLAGEAGLLAQVTKVLGAEMKLSPRA
jgi:hypothetical protein